MGLGDAADDAAVYRISAETAVVATVDFFAPVVDDPFTYGAIAAANAMSDVFAMGGEVVLALNVAAFPEDLPAETVSAILRGGAEKVAEAGGVVAGGHTVWDQEPKYGLSVLGTVHPERIFAKAGLRAGDRLFLTKPLGTGTLISAARNGRATEADFDEAIASMLQLNRHAAHLAREAGVRAATDITGFGLLGHAWEMASRSGVALEFDLGAMPVFEGALRSAADGFHTGGEGRNRAWLDGHVAAAEGLDDERASLLYDPQTSGGLLLAADDTAAEALITAFARDGLALWEVGRASEGTPHIAVR